MSSKLRISAQGIAKLLEVTEEEAQRKLDKAAADGWLVAVNRNGQCYYRSPPAARDARKEHGRKPSKIQSWMIDYIAGRSRSRSAIDSV
jgi:hypothetical protein